MTKKTNSSQIEMFAAREILQFGVNAHPLLALSDTTQLVLQVEDHRTPIEIEIDRMKAAEQNTDSLLDYKPILSDTEWCAFPYNGTDEKAIPAAIRNSDNAAITYATIYKRFTCNYCNEYTAYPILRNNRHYCRQCTDRLHDCELCGGLCVSFLNRDGLQVCYGCANDYYSPTRV